LGAIPGDAVTIATYAASVVLGVLCIGLFLLAVRRIVGRHETVVTAMLHRYDDRLAEFAQTLSDALNHTMPARVAAAISGSPPSEVQDHGVTRMLELARERTSADAAIAVVEGGMEPMLATVGLTEAEAAQVGGMGVPDYRGARAIQVSFNGDSERASRGSPIRAGVRLPLPDPEQGPGMLGVLSRAPDRTFSEIDITSLEDVLSVTRPGIETSLELREPDPVPELDPLTTLYDRPAFHSLLDREIARARGRRE